MPIRGESQKIHRLLGHKERDPILNIVEPQNKKIVQKLTKRLAALTRFIPKASERFQPFFETLKKSKEFEWTEECKNTLASIKNFLTNPHSWPNQRTVKNCTYT